MNQTIGYGVFATRLISRGSITWVRDELDQTYTPNQIEQMGEPYRDVVEKYTFVDAHGRFVLCWDLAKYINHSCDANCLSAGYDFELAVRDIAPGEELTDDYGTLNLDETFTCACSAANCRQQISHEDFLRYSDQWDASVQKAFPLIPRVSQPLWPWVKEREAVHQAVKNPSLLRPSLANYYPASATASLR